MSRDRREIWMIRGLAYACTPYKLHYGVSGWKAERMPWCFLVCRADYLRMAPCVRFPLSLSTDSKEKMEGESGSLRFLLRFGRMRVRTC